MDETQSGFRGPEFVEGKAVETEGGLEFLDAVLTIRTPPVATPDIYNRQRQRGHRGDVAPAREVTTGSSANKAVSKGRFALDRLAHEQDPA